MADDGIEQIGSLLIAFGTTISAKGETLNLTDENFYQNELAIIGDGFQAFGAFLLGVAPFPDQLGFFGNWADGIGAGTASIGLALSHFKVITEGEGERLIILGDSLQTIGNAMGAISNYQENEPKVMLGNAAQSLGSGLKTIGLALEPTGRSELGQYLMIVGTILQALGANYISGLTFHQ